MPFALAMLIGGVTPVSAGPAVGQVFPVPGHLVPLLVAAVFMLPAVAAGFVSLVLRLGGKRSRLVSALLLATVIAMTVAWVRPDLALNLKV